MLTESASDNKVLKKTLWNFTEGKSIIEVFLKISKLSQSTIFCNIFTCAEEVNYMKDYMKTKH